MSQISWEGESASLRLSLVSHWLSSEMFCLTACFLANLLTFSSTLTAPLTLWQKSQLSFLFFAMAKCVNVLLIFSGADVNAKSDGDRTSLHLASNEGHLDVVQLLVEHGADTTLHDKHSFSAQDLALKSGHREVSLYWFIPTDEITSDFIATFNKITSLLLYHYQLPMGWHDYDFMLINHQQEMTPLLLHWYYLSNRMALLLLQQYVSWGGMPIQYCIWRYVRWQRADLYLVPMHSVIMGIPSPVTNIHDLGWVHHIEFIIIIVLWDINQQAHSHDEIKNICSS